MDLPTFVVEMTKACAWPAAIVALVVCFRRVLIDLIPSLRELKVLGAELRFEQKAEAIVAELVHELKPEGEEASLGGFQDQRSFLKYAVTNLLDRNERLVVVLHYYEDLSLEDVATVMSLPLERVRELHLKVLKKLRDAARRDDKRDRGSPSDPSPPH